MMSPWVPPQELGVGGGVIAPSPPPHNTPDPPSSVLPHSGSSQGGDVPPGLSPGALGGFIAPPQPLVPPHLAPPSHGAGRQVGVLVLELAVQRQPPPVPVGAEQGGQRVHFAEGGAGGDLVPAGEGGLMGSKVTPGAGGTTGTYGVSRGAKGTGGVPGEKEPGVTRRGEWTRGQRRDKGSGEGSGVTPGAKGSLQGQRVWGHPRTQGHSRDRGSGGIPGQGVTPGSRAGVTPGSRAGGVRRGHGVTARVREKGLGSPLGFRGGLKGSPLTPALSGPRDTCTGRC